jgi:transcriptional regulator with XRE-family HTH domain
MQQNQNPKHAQNRVDIYRRRMRFSSAHVARLLGHKGTSALSNYERGERLPSLSNAFRLGIILRVPVEFLFPSLYDGLRGVIRAQEEHMVQPAQQVLF